MEIYHLVTLSQTKIGGGKGQLTKVADKKRTGTIRSLKSNLKTYLEQFLGLNSVDQLFSEHLKEIQS
jgi:hypothetical protein